MALGVCLLFDGRTERVLRNLWDRLEERGVPTLRTHTHGLHYPHLSYVVLLEWELAAVQAGIEALPPGDPLIVTFDAIAAFRRGRVALIPGATAEMVARQQAVVAAARRAGALVHEHYEVGRWLPHCSLATRARLEQLPVVAATAYDVLPLTAGINRAALIDSSTGRLWGLRNLP